ncbi:hypothetical protein [Sorangium sp. So ce131]|uniref:hypothetical protein n=1 Tax=Sorangium sp. So ce131 TaxID=3133282 RepID=UPI003F60BC3D
MKLEDVTNGATMEGVDRSSLVTTIDRADEPRLTAAMALTAGGVPEEKDQLDLLEGKT